MKRKNGEMKMPWLKASEIKLTDREKEILEQLAKGTHTPLHLKQRSQIILLANEGHTNNYIEITLKVSARTVKIWRDRYHEHREEINKVEIESPRKLRQTVEKVLSDLQRPGAPSTFTDVQVALIIAMSCEDPSKYNIPVSNWTPSLLKQKAEELGIVESISKTQISRFLKRERFKAS